MLDKKFIGKNKDMFQHEFEDFILVVERHPAVDDKKYFAYLKEIPEINAIGETEAKVVQQVNNLYYLFSGKKFQLEEQVPHPIHFLERHGKILINNHFQNCVYCQSYIENKNSK